MSAAAAAHLERRGGASEREEVVIRHRYWDGHGVHMFYRSHSQPGSRSRFVDPLEPGLEIFPENNKKKKKKRKNDYYYFIFVTGDFSCVYLINCSFYIIALLKGA